MQTFVTHLVSRVLGSQREHDCLVCLQEFILQEWRSPFTVQHSSDVFSLISTFVRLCKLQLRREVENPLSEDFGAIAPPFLAGPTAVDQSDVGKARLRFNLAIM
jgi:hypothetical protein